MMSSTLSALLAVPVLFGGYLLMAVTALAGAVVLGRDAAQLFLTGGISERLVRQRHYVTSMAGAVAFMVLVLFLILSVSASIALASAAVVLL